ncbi:MAG TPA: molybdopterin cofactor-binding domain-containing protein, partial [Casimicrobiaceae bacterium]|nr:molybdopterin cofactor-binding domain-containing protein [Casimicrobiaceae bacterium]
EPNAFLAEPATDGGLDVWASTQSIFGVRDAVAKVAGLDRQQVRVQAPWVGGGFGAKGGVYPEQLIVAALAARLGRAVLWVETRTENLLGMTHGRGQLQEVAIGVKRDGTITALQARLIAEVGAYAWRGAFIPMVSSLMLSGCYRIPRIAVSTAGVATNTTPTGPYRGAGRPEAIFIIERLIDEAARKTGIDRIELRRRNFIRPEQMPYRNPMKKTYDSGQFEKVMNAALALSDWNGFAARMAATKARGKLRGQGIATFLEWTGVDLFTESVSVTVSGDGYIEMFSATQGMGQGLLTTYAQLAVDVFGVPIDKVRILQGDTDRGTGFGSAGSRSLFVGGSAVYVAAKETVEHARTLASQSMEAAVADIEYANGEFRIAGTDRRVGLFELAAMQEGRRIDVGSKSSVDDATWPNGAHVCEVEIDPETGEVVIDGYWSVNDVGRVVNPMIVRGQLEGGALQGIGQALCERVVYDRESGQLLTGTLMDYALPRAEMIRQFTMTMDESTPCRNNPLGVKGVGELGTIGATPVLVNAIIDALWRAGNRQAGKLQMPLTSEVLLDACRATTVG